MRRILLALGLLALSAGMLISTQPGSGGPRKAEAEPTRVIVFNADICAALLAASAPDPAPLVFACLNPNLSGGTGGLALIYGGVPALHSAVIAAAAAMTNESDDVFPDAPIGFASCSSDADPIVDDIQELLCALDNRDGGIDGNFTIVASDYASLDLDANQLHDLDGQLNVAAFVNDRAPVTFSTNKGRWAGSPPDPNTVICPADIADGDCDDGTPGDGVVIRQLTVPLAGTGTPPEMGPGVITVDQEFIRFPVEFEVVGEGQDIAYFTLESQIGVGVEDLNGDGDLGDVGECPLETSVAGFTGALGTPERSIIIARALDDNDNQVAGVFIQWETSDPDRAVVATDVTPTLDLGSFGIGAPNIVCATDETGPVEVITTIMDSVAQGEVLLAVFDPEAVESYDSVEFTVVGLPASMTVTGTPGTLACDGVTTTEVAATVLDANGNLVVNGTEVRFDVSVLGTANPIIAKTSDGVAKSTIAPLTSSVPQGVPVVVTAGNVQQSVLVQCSGAGVPPGGQSGGQPGAPSGVIRPPDTGTSGLAAERGAMLLWPALGLVVGAAALAVARLAFKRA